MTKVYVAGASAERETRAKPVIAALKACGYSITHDWTEAVDMHGANENSTLDQEDLAHCALSDLEGVEDADILVMLTPKNKSTGAWVELGVALAKDIPIYIVGDFSQCIFGLLADFRFDTDERLIAVFQRWAK